MGWLPSKLGLSGFPQPHLEPQAGDYIQFSRWLRPRCCCFSALAHWTQ